MIRVLFFMDGIGNAGGIQEMAIKWMENIDHSKIKIAILTYNHVKSDNYVERVKKNGGDVYIIESYQDKGKFFESLKQTSKFFKQHHYDILHAHSSSKALFVLYYAKRAGIATRILHSHSANFTMQNKIVRYIAMALKKPSCLLATDYFACSSEAGQFLFGKKICNSDSYHIVHNAINLKDFSPINDYKQRFCQQMNIEIDALIIGNVGRFMPVKNHQFLIDVFEEVVKIDKKVHLVLIGNGKLESEIKKQVEQKGISHNVSFMGFRTDVNEIVNAFDVLVMPSLFEGLPVTAVEAQALGVPVLFSDTITKEAALLPDSKFVSLNRTPIEWAKYILEYKSHKHVDNPADYIKRGGYDIVDETKKLQEFYISKLEHE